MRTIKSVSLLREAHIRRNLDGPIFERAKEFFPGLRQERQIRAIGALGSAHRPVSIEFSGQRTRIEEIEGESVFSLGGQAAKTVAINSNPTPKTLEAAARLSSLSHYFDPAAGKMIANGQQALVARGFRRALEMSQEEFEQLSRRTAGITDQQKRMVFIVKYLTGENPG